MLELPVPDELDGHRLDAALHALAPDLSRRTARELAAAGAVSQRIARAFPFEAEGVSRWVRAAPSERVRSGDALAYEPSTIEISLELRLGVVHDDSDVCVVHKPPGLAAHAGPLVKDSLALRLQRIRGAGLSQRLDRGASGLLLVGKHADALRALAAAMESGAIDRAYVAIVAGGAVADGTIDVPLRVTDEPRGDRPKVVIDPAGGLPSMTRVRVLHRFRDAALVEATLETGRTHQIRAHLAHVGHPILGDPRYGDAGRNAAAYSTLGVARPLLHATRLAFPHPTTGARVSLEAVSEPDFARALRQLPGAGPAA